MAAPSIHSYDGVSPFLPSDHSTNQGSPLSDTCGNVFPFAAPTSTCRSRFTICSAVWFFPRAIHSSSCSSLSHLHWCERHRALHLLKWIAFLAKFRQDTPTWSGVLLFSRKPLL
jgi:hypothetical protein